MCFNRRNSLSLHTKALGGKMRMLSITDKNGATSLINPNQITQIWYCTSGNREVIISLSNGTSIRTKFTTIDYALDYIQRASSHSLVGG